MKPDKQQLIILGLAITVISGFGVFRYIPLVRRNRAIENRIAESTQLHDQVSPQSTLLPELRQQKEQLRDTLNSFSVKVPEQRDFARLWQEIADVMNECNLTEQLIQPGADLKSEQLCSIPLTLECQGSLEQLFEFFQELENMHRLVHIKEAEFESSDKYDSIVKLNAKASVYYQPEKGDKS